MSFLQLFYNLSIKLKLFPQTCIFPLSMANFFIFYQAQDCSLQTDPLSSGGIPFSN